MMTNILNKNDINRVQRVNQRSQIGIRDIFLELKIDTFALPMSFDYVINRIVLEKMRIVNVELNIKKPTYFTGVEDLYMTTLKRLYGRPFFVQIPLYDQATMDQILNAIEDVIYAFIRDYNRAKK
jgi:hypothetical protein